MKSILKRSTAILLLLSMLLSAAACSESTENSADETEAQTEAQAAEAVVETEEETDDGKTHYADEIPEVNYDGWTMNIANDGLSADYFSAFVMEELTGDNFNDAIYNRNERVMEKFNVKIIETNNGTTSTIKSDVTAGSNEVAFGYCIFRSCMGLISQDYIRPITSMPVFDLSKPYWDAGSQETLTFGGNLYYGHCDISFDHYEGMATLFYNGELLSDNNITETPYDLYMDGRWTLDNMHSMMTVVARDANGDGKMDIDNDIYGFTGRDFEFLPALHSSRTSLIKYDESTQAYELNFTDDTVMGVGDMLNKIINDESIAYPAWNDASRNMFKAGDVLFYSRLLGDFRHLRDKEDDYGLICYPGLEENVDGMVYIQNPYTVLIPVNCEDDYRLATLIEALAADTYDNVLDVYINKAVIGKGARDEESANMLKIMITKRAYDLCYAFSLDSVIESFGAAIKKGQYASATNRIKNLFKKDLNKAMDKLTEEWIGE